MAIKILAASGFFGVGVLALISVACASSSEGMTTGRAIGGLNAAKEAASACPHDPPFIIPKNKLVNFDRPNRVPNAYLVGFKCAKAFDEYAANSATRRSQVLPTTLPTSQTNCAALASAYAVRFEGSVSNVSCNFGFRGFLITGITEAAISDLAQDDRVEYVEPDQFTTTS